MTLFVKVLLTLAVFDPYALDTFALPKSAAAHSASLVLAALLGWLFVRYRGRLVVWSPAHVAVGLMLVAFSLSSILALDRTIALFGTPRRFLGLSQMLDNVVLYVGAVTLLREARALRLVAFVALGPAALEALYLFVQKAGLDPIKYRDSATALIGTLGNPDLLGSYLAIAGISALGLAFLLVGRLSRPAVAGLVLLGISCMLGPFLVGVRAGVLAVAAGFVATALLAVRVPWRRPWWRRGLVAFGVLLVAGILVSPVAGRLRPDTLVKDPAITMRVAIWDAAAKAVIARPVLGIGPDNFVVFYPAHRAEASGRTGLLENSTHSMWLYVATSAGLIGLIGLFLFVALVTEAGIRGARAGAVGSLALVPFLAFVGQSFVGINEVVLEWVFWLSAGMVAGAAGRALRRPRTGYRRPTASRLIGGVAVAAAVLIIFSQVMPRIVANEAIAHAESLSGLNRGDEAIPYAQEAIRADGRRGEAWSTYGTALTTAGRLAPAIAAYTAASEREPWGPLGWRNLAIVWAQLGNRNAAAAAAEKALVVDPFDGESHDLMASLAYEAGDYARAAVEGERAIALRPLPLESTFYTAASAYIQLKDFARAEAIDREGIVLYPHARLRLQLAAVLADEGKKAEALAIVDALIAAGGNTIEAERLKQALTTK